MGLRPPGKGSSSSSKSKRGKKKKSPPQTSRCYYNGLKKKCRKPQFTQYSVYDVNAMKAAMYYIEGGSREGMPVTAKDMTDFMSIVNNQVSIQGGSLNNDGKLTWSKTLDIMYSEGLSNSSSVAVAQYDDDDDDGHGHRHLISQCTTSIISLVIGLIAMIFPFAGISGARARKVLNNITKRCPQKCSDGLERKFTELRFKINLGTPGQKASGMLSMAAGLFSVLGGKAILDSIFGSMGFFEKLRTAILVIATLAAFFLTGGVALAAQIILAATALADVINNFIKVLNIC